MVSRSVRRQQNSRKRRIKIARQRIDERKKRVQQRIRHKAEARDEPMFRARNIQFKLADRAQAICYGGIGLLHSLARECGLIEAIDAARRTVWARQPDAFFDQATVDMDGHIVETGGECKQGIDISYDGRWSYHPLLLSLAETGEPLRIVNRAGNRPSHEGAAAHCDDVAAMLRAAGFRNILFRGDTDYSQTERLDRWDAAGIVFHFGYDAMPTLVKIADDLADSKWKRLRRPPRYTVKTRPRAKPERVKEQIVVAREFKNIVLKSEDVAEFDYRPTACNKTYRMIVVRKNLSV